MSTYFGRPLRDSLRDLGREKSDACTWGVRSHPAMFRPSSIHRARIPHTFTHDHHQLPRTCSRTRLDIIAIQALLGHRDLRATMISTHAVDRGLAAERYMDPFRHLTLTTHAGGPEQKAERPRRLEAQPSSASGWCYLGELR